MSKLEEMQTSIENLSNQVDETLLALDDIKKSVEDSGIEVGNAPLTEYADKVSALYDKGVKDEYDRFWDAYLDNGNLADCSKIFGGKGWDDSIFKPKYSLKPINANYMFSQTNIQDYKGILESQNVTFDFSDCTTFYDFFWASTVTRIGEIDMRNATNVYEAFDSCKNLKSIDKVIFKNTPYSNASSVFYNTPNLESVIIEGKIYEDPRLDRSSKLNKSSITSFMHALAEDATGKTCTFSLTAINNAFETSEGTADGSTSQEWLDLVTTKSNWTISLK